MLEGCGGGEVESLLEFLDECVGVEGIEEVDVSRRTAKSYKLHVSISDERGVRTSAAYP